MSVHRLSSSGLLRPYIYTHVDLCERQERRTVGIQVSIVPPEIRERVAACHYLAPTPGFLEKGKQTNSPQVCQGYGIFINSTIASIPFNNSLKIYDF